MSEILIFNLKKQMQEPKFQIGDKVFIHYDDDIVFGGVIELSICQNEKWGYLVKHFDKHTNGRSMTKTMWDEKELFKTAKEIEI